MAFPSSTGIGLGVPDDDQLRAEVAVVLSSEDFRRSPKISRLLQYLCDKQINGQAAEITEYGIALEALGRDAQFDPQQDAVVRVDLHHLRKKLNKYYTGEGACHPIQIAIPNGQYAPLFVRREESEAPVEPAEKTPPEPQPLVEKSRSGRWKWFLALVPVVAVVIWAMLHGRSNPAKPAPALAPAVDTEIRIAAGKTTEGYVDTAGRIWQPDRYFTGGAAFHRASAPIQRTYDSDLFQNGREGQFSYSIPLPSGIYELHLYLAETGVASDTLRTINFAINGQPASAIDVASDAGGINTATMKVFTNITPTKDGFLDLAFGGPSPGFLNAIELVPGISNKMQPFRMTARDGIFRDHLGSSGCPRNGWPVAGNPPVLFQSAELPISACINRKGLATSLT